MCVIDSLWTICTQYTMIVNLESPWFRLQHKKNGKSNSKENGFSYHDTNQIKHPAIHFTLNNKMPLKALHPDIYSNALHLKQQQKFAENSADKRIGVIKQWSQRIRPKIANDEPGTGGKTCAVK